MKKILARGPGFGAFNDSKDFNDISDLIPRLTLSFLLFLSKKRLRHFRVGVLVEGENQ
jgi:hypothetical protein